MAKPYYGDDPSIEDVIGDVLGRMSQLEKMELAAELMIAKIVVEEPYISMTGVQRDGFLIFMAQKCLECALDPNFDRELEEARMRAREDMVASRSDDYDTCTHDSEPIFHARSGYLGDIPAYELVRICPDCGMELG
jgi:hypothetical protein